MLDLLKSAISGSDIPTGSEYNSVGSFSGVAINFMLGLSFSLSILGMAYSGIQYILSAGDKKAVQKAWRNFLWSFIAAMVTIAAFVFKNSILYLIGVSSKDITGNVPTF